MSNSDQETQLLALIKDLDLFAREKRFPSGLNIFEAAGMQRQEIRHSNLLAFLLNPQENHGLGDGFLRQLLQRALDASLDPKISPLKIALADLSDALISREWRNIDLLVESKNNKLAFVIENKIDASESDNQLAKYESSIDSTFPSYEKLFVYLTAN